MVTVPLRGSERLLSINLAGALLCTQTNFGNICVYDAESGQFLWTAHLDRPTGVAWPASVNSTSLFVTNSNKLYSLDRRSGRPIWVAELPALPTSPTACDEHRVYVGLQSGKVYAYNSQLSTMKLAVKGGGARDEYKSRPDTPWNWQTSGSVTGRPLPAGAVIAFGSSDGKVYVSQTEAAVMLYRFATAGRVTASVAPLGLRTLIVPSTDKNVYAVDLWTAETKWVNPTGAPVDQEPLVADDNIYVINEAGMLFSLDPETGVALWQVPTHGGRLLAIGKTRVYLESHDGDLFVVDRKTGKMVVEPRMSYGRAGLNLREFQLSPTNSQNDRLYFGTQSGLVICIREVGQLAPVPLRNPKSLPFGYLPPEGIDLRGVGQPKPTTVEAPPGENTPPEGEKKDEGGDKEKEMPKEEEPK